MRNIFLLFFYLCGSTVAFAQYFPEDLPVSAIIKSDKLTFRTQEVVTGLEIPWSMAFLPNGNVLVTERAGRLRIIENGKLNPTPIKNVPKVFAKGQGGLLDVVLHPDYIENGWIYFSLAYYTDADKGHTKIIRAKLKDNSLTEIQTLFKGKPGATTTVHFGGKIVFDADGKLFFGIGERGTMQNAQNTKNHSGKIFRLNDDGSIPSDNPFVHIKDAMPEIWSYGHRNPQGLALNPFTNELWEHEHGPKGGDEINIIKKGQNYGWPVVTFGINYNGSVISKDTVKDGITSPVYYWNPSIAPSGMVFIKSDRYPEWNGNAMIGALSFASLYRCEIKDNEVIYVERLLERQGRIRDIRLAPDGYLYFTNESKGTMVRIVPQKEY